MTQDHLLTPSNWQFGRIKEIDLEKLQLTISAADTLSEPTVVLKSSDPDEVELLRFICKKRLPFGVHVDPAKTPWEGIGFSLAWLGTPVERMDAKDGLIGFRLLEVATIFYITENEFASSPIRTALEENQLQANTRVVFIVNETTFQVRECVRARDDFPPGCNGSNGGSLQLGSLEHVDRTEAGRMYDLLNSLRCHRDSETGACDPAHRHHDCCIPFSMPDGGCESRAHLSCRILNRQSPGKVLKVFIELGTDICTPDALCPTLRWSFHMAPAVFVGEARELHVLDPSLFPEPVTKRQWAERFGKNEGDIFEVPHTTFMRRKPLNGDPEWTLDDDYNCAQMHLDFYRAKLSRRIQEQRRCPPYQPCL
jgi:hypothetical protein